MFEDETLSPSPFRPPIQKLPEELINQIAAGEVVERPASIIKELCENSLDAGATRIDIMLVEGGTEEITILDNGCGIPEMELPLALERHATSKIRTLPDLEHLQTFGFRGEALASIASVSQIEVTSRTSQMSRAAMVRADFGLCVEAIQYVAAPQGTCIKVKKLFHKIPARQKFLRSASTEFSHCSRLVKELALGNPSIAFYLHHQGRLVQSFAPGDRLSRLKECLKPAWAPFRWKQATDGIAVEAFLTPADWISDRGEIFLFLNGRPIRNKTILSALRNAYQTMLGQHHEPSGVLYLEMKSDWVDVNVHPQKWEVRILRQDAIYAWLLGTIKRGLPQLSVALREQPAMGYATQVQEPSIPYTTQTPSADHYLLVEKENCLFIVDKHLLAETARHEEWKARGLSGKRLPRPFMYRHRVDQAEALRYLDALRSIAIEAQFFDGGEWAIQVIPSTLGEDQIAPFLQTCFARIEASQAELCLADLACLTSRHWDELWLKTKLEKYRPMLENGLTCPHGKLIAYSISNQELTKFFGRCEQP